MSQALGLELIGECHFAGRLCWIPSRRTPELSRSIARYTADRTLLLATLTYIYVTISFRLSMSSVRMDLFAAAMRRADCR